MVYTYYHDSEFELPYIYILEKSMSMLCNAFIISAILSSPPYLEKFRLRSSYHYWIFPLFKPRTYACFNNVIKCKPPIFLGIYCIFVLFVNVMSTLYIQKWYCIDILKKLPTLYCNLVYIWFLFSFQYKWLFDHILKGYIQKYNHGSHEDIYLNWWPTKEAYFTFRVYL